MNNDNNGSMDTVHVGYSAFYLWISNCLFLKEHILQNGSNYMYVKTMYANGE